MLLSCVICQLIINNGDDDDDACNIDVIWLDRNFKVNAASGRVSGKGWIKQKSFEPGTFAQSTPEWVRLQADQRLCQLLWQQMMCVAQWLALWTIKSASSIPELGFFADKKIIFTCVRRLTHVIAIGWTSVRHTLLLCQTAQPIVKLSSLPGSPVILVFWGPNFFLQFQWEHPNGGVKCKG